MLHLPPDELWLKRTSLFGIDYLTEISSFHTLIKQLEVTRANLLRNSSVKQSWNVIDNLAEMSKLPRCGQTRI